MLDQVQLDPTTEQLIGLNLVTAVRSVCSMRNRLAIFEEYFRQHKVLREVTLIALRDATRALRRAEEALGREK